MSTQPEPESGYAVDQIGVPFYVSRHGGKTGWARAVRLTAKPWDDVVDERGPMTPLLPAERPDNVPEDAVPFVGWVAWSRKHPGLVDELMPDGREIKTFEEAIAKSYGLPVPPKPEPTLAERLREGSIIRDDNGFPWAMISAELLNEAADELENRR